MAYATQDLNTSQQAEFNNLTKKIRHEWEMPESELNEGSIYRFYSSQNFNIAKTSQAIQKHIQWRQKFPMNEAANLSQNTYEVVAKNAAIGLYGNDKEGRPIGYISSKNPYPFDAIHSVGTHQVTLYQIQMFERLSNIVFPLCSKKYEKNINNMICVIDAKQVCPTKMLRDFGLMRFIFSTMALYRDNYPELNYKTVVINTNNYILYFWGVIKMFMRQTTIDKFSFYDENYLAGLLQITTLDQIPVELGGTCPYPIEEYPNFFNPEIKNSVEEKKLTL